MRGTQALLALAGLFPLALGDAVTFTLGHPNDYQVTGVWSHPPSGPMNQDAHLLADEHRGTHR